MESKENKRSRLLTKEQDRKCSELEGSSTPYAKEVADQFRKGKIDSKTFEEAREALRDPNKMQQDSYKYFMKALAKGRFPDRAKHAGRFLKALGSSEEEAFYAKELVKEISDESSGQLSNRRERDSLAKLKELRNEKVASSVAKSTTMDIAGAINKVAETKEGNWSVEKPPEEFMRRVNELEFTKAKAILQRIGAKQKELDLALNSHKDEKIIASLEAEIAQMDEEYEQNRAELEPLKEQWRAYLKKMGTRYEAIGKFFDRSGIDINSASRIKMWMFEHGSTLKMESMVSDQNTGETVKKIVSIEIVGIHFKNEKTDGEADSPGELVIDYINEKGETVKDASYKVFLNMIMAFEAYEEIDSLQEVNEKIATETHNTDVSVGQEYATELIVGLDDKGEPLKENHLFKIQAIDERKKTITLDRNTVTIPRQWISNSVDPLLYFDRKKREFTYGEFAKFVKQHSYQRDFDISEMDEIITRKKEAQQKTDLKMVQGCSDATKEQCQESGLGSRPKFEAAKADSAKEIIFIDKNGGQRWGILEANEQTGKYSITPADASGENMGNDYIKALLESGVPMNIAAARPARIGFSAEELSEMQNISPSKLLKMIDDGNIANAPTEDPHKGGRWVLKKNPHSKAAITMINKDETGNDMTMVPEEDDTPDSIPSNDKNKKDKIPEFSQQADVPENGPSKKKKPKYYDHVLAYDDIFKAGDMTGKTTNFLAEIWTETRFMSLSDMWEMGKAMWEYYDRRFQRRQKAKYSSVGKDLPFWAPEMQRINQAAETEQVNQFKESFEQYGVYQIQERLRKTRNRDEFKACYITLADKGQLRWDDIEMWQNLNRFVAAGVAVPIPKNGDPNNRVSETDPRTGFDFLKGAIDSLWGEGQYNEWFAKNKNTFQSNAKSYYEEGKQLEGVDGGHGRRLGVLLQQHKNGEFVDPHEYEGLILHAIEAGKSTMQEKIYYMIEGVACENKNGRTILPFDRMAHINSEMLLRFPILEYLCASVPRPPKGKKHRLTLDDYKEWVYMFDRGDPQNPDNFKPDKEVDKFMWETVIPSDETQNRINKAIRNGENLDHDDMFAYLPPASTEVVTDTCKATTGSKKFLTIEGYANAFPGFSQYMRSLAASSNKEKLRDAIKSYVRFEAIMTSKYEKNRTDYQRMEYGTLNSATIVSPNTPPQAFINELNGGVAEVIKAYDDPELNELFRWMNETTPNFRTSREEQEKQKKIDQAFDRFDDVFNRVVKSDNGDKMLAIIAGTHLEGLPRFISSEEQEDARKAKYSDSMALS